MSATEQIDLTTMPKRPFEWDDLDVVIDPTNRKRVPARAGERWVSASAFFEADGERREKAWLDAKSKADRQLLGESVEALMQKGEKPKRKKESKEAMRRVVRAAQERAKRRLDEAGR